MSASARLSAVVCAAAHPFDPAVLCARLPHADGLHTADGAQPWDDTNPEDTP